MTHSPRPTPTDPVRRADDRGHTDLGWLDSRHSFSFGGYHDPDRTGFHGLRVLNDDRVAPGQGFGTHPHRDMEILTWVLDGELAHRDSMGHGSTLGPGGVQFMSAGRGVTHSEFNASDDEPVHFLQIWIEPNELGAEPRYREANPELKGRGLVRVAAAEPEAAADELPLRADAAVYLADLEPGQTVKHPAAPGRRRYLHLATSSAHANGHTLSAGDALTLGPDEPLSLTAADPTRLLLFDLAERPGGSG